MSPKLVPLLAAGLLAGATAFAQFDLGKLSKALDKAKQVTDTAKEAGKVAKGVAGIGPEEERVIGDSVALEIIDRYGGLVREADTLRRVNLIGRALALYSERPDHAWRFGVLNSETVNAFSAPDGYVFITQGLYQLAADDDQLAGILGHEIAHVTRKHALNMVRRDELFSGGKSLLSRYSADYREADAKVQQVDAQLQQFDAGVGKIATALIEKGFDQPTEYTADLAGRQLATLTGYAPGGLRAVLAQLQRQSDPAQKVFSTHPPLAERIKRLPDESVTAPKVLPR
ncbi:MAG: M48 family metallopeptidase [bacterium]|nr:M48 family metallopeptidase [bacterium]MDI1337127.1 M48 family metallopeptidase [Lacunisphaera sp.]